MGSWQFFVRFILSSILWPFALFIFPGELGFRGFDKDEALFQTHENLEHLAMMETVLGPLPQHMIMRADRRFEKYFRRGARLDWPEGATSRESMSAVWKLPRLQNLVMQHVDHSAGVLIDLLQGLLRLDQVKRTRILAGHHLQNGVCSHDGSNDLLPAPQSNI